MLKRSFFPQGNPTLSKIQAIALVFFSLLGLLASFQLLETEIKVLNDPAAAITCDVNPLIACSNSLLSPQAHLLGPPNSVLGLVAFSVLLTLAVLLWNQVQIPTWFWWGMGISSGIGMIYVVYFMVQSTTVFGALCPYCMLIWAATIGVAVLVWSNIIAAGLVGQRLVATGVALSRFWIAIIFMVYLLITLDLLVGFRDVIANLL